MPNPVSRETPLSLGTVVPPYGRIAAVGVIQGERYYWLIRRAVVSMMPADVIEGSHTDAQD